MRDAVMGSIGNTTALPAREAPGSQTSLREANRQRVLAAVRQFGGLAQVELAEATGLSTATVSTIVKELVSAGVVETSATTSSSGRRALLVTLSRQAGVVSGIHIGGRSLSVIIGDLAGEVLAEQSLPLPVEHRPDTTLDRAAVLLADLLEHVGSNPGELQSIAVALAWPVDPANGLPATRGTPFGWDEVVVQDVLRRRFPVPIAVESASAAAALAEQRLGAARDADDVIYVRCSHTTSAGIILGGQLRRGSSGTAGQIGHVQANPAGAICRCGNRGCLDVEAGETALLNLVRPAFGDIRLSDLVRRAQDGDPVAHRALGDAGTLIGQAISGLITSLDPHVIVVGGMLAGADVLVTALRDAVVRHTLPRRFSTLTVVPAQLGARAETLGSLEVARTTAAITHAVVQGATP